MTYDISKHLKDLTYFYTENYLKYSCERSGYINESYTHTINECSFIAPLLRKDSKIESGKLSYLPCPYASTNNNPAFLKNCMKDYLSLVLENKRIAIRQDPLVKYSNGIILSFLRAGFTPNIFFTSIIDLMLTTKHLWSNIRKRYHSLINKFKPDNGEFLFKIVTQSNCDEYAHNWIFLYKKLLSRGINTNQMNLESIINSIKDNLGTLYLLYKNKELISGIHISHTNDLAYYSAAGTHPEYERHDYFSHFLMWQAIMDLKNKGFKKLEIGPIFYKNIHNFYNHSEKEILISQFKLGFGGAVIPFIIFEYIRGINDV